MFIELLQKYQKEQPDNQWWGILLQYPDWEILQKKFHDVMESFLLAEIPFYPPHESIFKCFELCTYTSTRCILLGQDPYIHKNEAMGLCFSIPPYCSPVPPSLRNMFKELLTDLEIQRTNTDLTDWSKQGMLMLNTSLTVLENKSNSHKNIWKPFIDWFIQNTFQTWNKPLLVILWGKDAQNSWKIIHNPFITTIQSAHPSPLSATKGFFGSKPYSKMQEWFMKNGYLPFEFI